MRIGNIELSSRVALAPMAGVTDVAFRQICSEMGAALTCTELISSKALCYRDKKTFSLLTQFPGEHPGAVQIFGSDPVCMAEAAQIALEATGCDIIDHVKTQFPYCAGMAVISFVLYVIFGFVM